MDLPECPFDMCQELSLELPNLGLWHLNIPQAAALIAKCLWMDGSLGYDVKVPEKEAYGLNDPDLEQALAKPITHYEKLLVDAVTKGTLATARIMRNMDDKPQKTETYISQDNLLGWLAERGIELAHMDLYEDYTNAEVHIGMAALETIKAARITMAQGAHYRQSSSENYYQKTIILYEENLRLKDELEKYKSKIGGQKPISERKQGAYLNIIGALLGLLLGKSPGGKPYSQFETQQAVIDAIHGNYGEQGGLSKRNLEDKFAQAKRNLETKDIA